MIALAYGFKVKNSCYKTLVFHSDGKQLFYTGKTGVCVSGVVPREIEADWFIVEGENNESL
jgi:hypothetical protein